MKNTTRVLSVTGLGQNPGDAQLAAAARQAIISAAMQNGGHLASNLGAVELTLALHRVFDPEVDRIVFDVGHQCYTHKWLTGRDISGIRTQGGVSGFPKPSESRADAFATGHASTAISAALGLARARDLLGQTHTCIAVVGDGALTGGMCYEALCDAGSSKTPLIVVVNDNKMSISASTGAMHDTLTRLRASRRYNRTKQWVERGLNRIPWVGRPLTRMVKHSKNLIAWWLLGSATMFEGMGFTYYGPLDGHNVPEMVRFLTEARDMKQPVLIHMVTTKGRGLTEAETDPEDWHGVEGSDGRAAGPCAISASLCMGEWLTEAAARRPELVAITAAMQKGTGLFGFTAAHPDRFFDVGIAEEHAITLAGGMAMAGLRPVVCLYSTFLQRAADQLLHDVCLQSRHAGDTAPGDARTAASGDAGEVAPGDTGATSGYTGDAAPGNNRAAKDAYSGDALRGAAGAIAAPACGLPVTFCIDRCGPIGPDGETHQGIYDLALLRAMPGLVVLSPASASDLHSMLDWATAQPGPVAIRYARGPFGLEERDPPEAQEARKELFRWRKIEANQAGSPAPIATNAGFGGCVENAAPNAAMPDTANVTTHGEATPDAATPGMTNETTPGMANATTSDAAASGTSPGAIALLSTGEMIGEAQKAQAIVREKGVAFTLLHAPCLSDVDETFLRQYTGKTLYVLEGHVWAGGYACAVAAAVARMGLSFSVHGFCCPEAPMPHAGVAEQLEAAGISARQIAACIAAQA